MKSLPFGTYTAIRSGRGLVVHLPAKWVTQNQVKSGSPIALSTVEGDKSILIIQVMKK